MSSPSWRLDDVADEAVAAAPINSGLVTLHFLLNALRSQWRFWVSFGCIGMLVGVAWMIATPPRSFGTVTVMLAHDPGTDPNQAMSTDVSLLRTRTLAADVVKRLGLHMSPEDFQLSVESNAVTNDVLVLDVSGPSKRDAVARARALANEYLEFRASQIRSQLEALTRGYRERSASLQRQLADLDKHLEAVQQAAPGDTQQTVGLLNKRAQVSARLESTKQSIQDASLKSSSIIDASRVLDPASPKPDPSTARVLLMAMASGLVGGTAVGASIVLVRALTSNRLRLREEVALALEAPVRVSVGKLGQRSPWGSLRGATTSSRSLQLLVEAVDAQINRSHSEQPAASTRKRPRELTRPVAPTRLALASVDNVEVARLVIAHLAAKLAAEGLAVFVVDLTEAGGLEETLASVVAQPGMPPSERQPVVYRPDGVPTLTQGPAGLSMATPTGLPETYARRDAWDKADVSLTLVEVDPAVGVDHLSSWATEVVVLVTAGRSSAERLRTTAELMRTAGLRLLFAMLVGSHGTDETPGLPGTTVAAEARPIAKTTRSGSRTSRA